MIFEIKPTPVEDYVKIVEVTVKDLEYYINLADKEASGFERINTNFQRSPTVDNMSQRNHL